jgi:hypothetical protein
MADMLLDECNAGQSNEAALESWRSTIRQVKVVNGRTER